MCFVQTHNQGTQQFFEGVLGHLCLARRTQRCPFIPDVSKARHEARLMALEGRRVSSKKPQGSETVINELLGGTKENKFLSNEESLICPPGILY